MEFNYEVLGDDGFQKLAQSLLVKEFPNVQCFPVGEQDGGRDALQWIWLDEDQEFIVYQVKFNKNYHSKASRSVIVDTIKTELSKIKKLSDLGAIRYVLITNVAGTGALGVGAIDKANKEFSQALGMPAQVWWRDDIDARIRSDVDMKWSFPQMLKATDLLPILLSGFDEENVSIAIKGYMNTQYAAEKDVKFKQVEMRHGLLDLYVDLPIGQKSSPKFRLSHKRVTSKIYNIRAFQKEYSFENTILDGDSEGNQDQDRIPGDVAAAKILSWDVPNKGGFLVLEGAPGQGKSTVTQYISQVNRLSLLSKADDLRKLSADHVNMPIRVPFRIDLRDFATWVNGSHPYAKNKEHLQSEVSLNGSLETFLAMQISWFSGGHSVDVSQLHRFLRRSHCLFVLDGFDEIADIPTRALVVERICEAAERLGDLCLTALVIVTSRPAAFANSPGFPEDSWTHLELRDLRSSDVEKYRDKWSRAQRLSPDEYSALTETLAEKLQYSHLQELARNPMQLAILLHLIHIQGPALPDKRTSLYDKYIELFFNREAEKSGVIRTHRDLILGIHGFVAWTIQVQTERGESSGSVSAKELRSIVDRYLKEGEHEDCSLDDLLIGMVERVVALVSRVEGTYEFEVQPIREYFAAKFLYSTAAYSPVGEVKRGTRPERLDALARSFYWTNVTRFFCGFYDIGELPALVQGLVQLSEDADYSLINHSRSLALMLLSDWVFSQSPRSTRQIIEFITECPGFYRLGDYGRITRRGRSRYSFNLPDASGQKRMVEKCLELLRNERNFEKRNFICSVISKSSVDNDVIDSWMCTLYSSDFVNFVPESNSIGVEGNLSIENVLSVFEFNKEAAIRYLSFYGRFGDILNREILFNAYFDMCMSASYGGIRDKKGSGNLYFDVISDIFDIRLYYYRISGDKDGFMLGRFRFPESVSSFISDSVDTSSPEYVVRTKGFLKSCASLSVDQNLDWQHSLSPWRELVDIGLSHYPNASFFKHLALMSSGVRSTKEKGFWGRKGWRFDEGIVDRLRYARLKSSASKWWAEEISKELDTEEAYLCLVTCLIWSSGRVLSEIHKLIEEKIDSMGPSFWHLIRTKMHRAIHNAGPAVSKLLAKDVLNFAKSGSHKVSFLLVGRIRRGSSVDSVYKYLSTTGLDCGGSVLRLAIRCELYGASDLQGLSTVSKNPNWDNVLLLSKRLVDIGFYGRVLFPVGGGLKIPDPIATILLRDSGEHLPELVEAAERSLSLVIASKAKLVAEVADEDNWSWF